LRETPPKRLISAMKNTLQDMVRGGITTFADFREGDLEGVRLLRAAVKGVGIRTLALGRPSFQFQEVALEANNGEFQPEGIEDVRRLMCSAEGLGLSSPNEFTDRALQQISEFKGRGLIATHTAEHQRAIDTSVSRTGFRDVERALRYLRADFLVHLTRATKVDIHGVAEAGVPVVCCPRANAALGLGLPPMRGLVERGVTVALGTDNVMVNSPDLFREMEFTTRFLRVETGDPKIPTPLEIFSMVTINAARLLGLGGELGSIDRGKLADLVGIDAEATNLRPIRDPLSTLVNRVRPDNVKMVFVGGNMVYKRS
jgi:cytosine/adenosine deaminase-related metal-dependent hydrolase